MVIKTEKDFLEFIKQQENNLYSPSIPGEYAQMLESIIPYLVKNAEISAKTFAGSVRNLIAAKLLYKKNIKS